MPKFTLVAFLMLFSVTGVSAEEISHNLRGPGETDPLSERYDTIRMAIEDLALEKLTVNINGRVIHRISSANTLEITGRYEDVRNVVVKRTSSGLEITTGSHQSATSKHWISCLRRLNLVPMTLEANQN